MSTSATAIRDAVFTRLSALPGYTKKRRVLTPQLQPADLPCLSVSIVTEQMTPDGDANAGPPSFVSLVTIGIGVARGFQDPLYLDGQIDADVDAIEAKLFTDPSFVTFGAGALFESINQVTRRRLYPFEGETYFCELRLEVTFETRVDFEPVIPDDFTKLDIETREIVRPTTSPQIETIVTLPTE